ncbi:MAG: GNAT family N-acetyltransferase [Candidatus Rokubacteria bacterium]|nr:GNAT family N-acetyltransferase [Candidatus Rokubacteria bacterium]
MTDSFTEIQAGGRILIRRYQPEDAPRVFEAASESIEQIFPWMPWCHPAYSLDESRAWIQHCEAAWATGAEYNFAVVDHATRFLGGCGLNQLRPEHRVANLGYWIRTSATGKGVATAAVRGLTEFAFRETNLVRLEIVVALGNLASHRVAEKVGAIREGIAHDRLHVHGKSHDAIVYALLRSRYGR